MLLKYYIIKHHKLKTICVLAFSLLNKIQMYYTCFIKLIIISYVYATEYI